MLDKVEWEKGWVGGRGDVGMPIRWCEKGCEYVGRESGWAG